MTAGPRANHSQVHIGAFSGREPDQSSNKTSDDGVNGRCNPTAPRAPVVRRATEISELLSNLFLGRGRLNEASG